MSEFRIDQIKNQDATGGPNVAGITTFTGTSGLVIPSGPGIPDNILPGLRGSTFTAWQGLTATRAAVTKHAAIAPDGTQTADQIANADNSNNAKNIYSYQNFDTAGTYIGEVFFKRVSSSTTPYVSMYIDAPAANQSYVVFNLRDGIVETDYNQLTEHSDTSKNTQYLMESVGNGWYRCAIMVKTISTTNRPFSFWPPGEDLDAVDPNNPYYTGDTTNNKIYAWHPLLYRVEPNKNISEVISNIDLRIGNTTPGAIRFNTDSMKLEYYHGGPLGIGTDTTGEWVQLTSDTPEIQTGGTRGVFGGGDTPTPTMDYVNVSTTGDAIDFDDLTYNAAFICKGGAASRVRGLFQGGRVAQNTINGFTFASTGSAFDFGNLTVGREDPAGVSNSTRGVFMAGGQHPGVSPYSGFLNTIDYVTIPSSGNARDFGDTTESRRHQGTCCSQTRGVCAAGYNGPAGTPSNVIDYITISTQGNAADFGDATDEYYGTSGSSNSIRGVFSAGRATPGNVNTIFYITIATLGNASDFGDLIDTSQYAAGVVSSPTRVCVGGGATPSNTNRISYVEIASTGDANDFGDLTVARQHFGGTSNGHGGLG